MIPDIIEPTEKLARRVKHVSSVNHSYLSSCALTSINIAPELIIIIDLIQRRRKPMSIHDNRSQRNDACARPFSPVGLVIIGALVLLGIVLWQYGPSVGTLVLLPLMLICPLTHFFMHRHRT